MARLVMLTSIVIPTVFNDTTLRRCVDLVKEHTRPPYELLVLDNGSEARGCVHALNQGLRAADGEVLVCLNDDCQPTPGWLEPLLAAIERGVWLCCPQWKFARIAGHCMAFPRAAYEFTGGFDEGYRHFSADHHFEMLLAQADRPIQQVVESVVHHDPNDPGRIHYRKTALLDDHERLPNTGEWYNIDNARFHQIWGGRVPSDYWPTDWASGAIGGAIQ